MGEKSKINGENGENLVAKVMVGLGFWTHLIQRNRQGGQPFDVVACKGGLRETVWLLDAKYVNAGATFRFDDVQPNQIESMRYASSFAGISNIGFAIVFRDLSESAWFLPYDRFMAMRADGKLSVNAKDLSELDGEVRKTI